MQNKNKYTIILNIFIFLINFYYPIKILIKGGGNFIYKKMWPEQIFALHDLVFPSWVGSFFILINILLATICIILFIKKKDSVFVSSGGLGWLWIIFSLVIFVAAFLTNYVLGNLLCCATI